MRGGNRTRNGCIIGCPALLDGGVLRAVRVRSLANRSGEAISEIINTFHFAHFRQLMVGASNVMCDIGCTRDQLSVMCKIDGYRDLE